MKCLGFALLFCALCSPSNAQSLLWNPSFEDPYDTNRPMYWERESFIDFDVHSITRYMTTGGAADGTSYVRVEVVKVRTPAYYIGWAPAYPNYLLEPSKRYRLTYEYRMSSHAFYRSPILVIETDSGFDVLLLQPSPPSTSTPLNTWLETSVEFETTVDPTQFQYWELGLEAFGTGAEQIGDVLDFDNVRLELLATLPTPTLGPTKTPTRTPTPTSTPTKTPTPLPTVKADVEMWVTGRDSDSIIRFNAETGTAIETFVPSGILDEPHGMTVGPDHNLYVCAISSDAVYRFNGATGQSMGIFASGGGMDRPVNSAFGPDGNLYVTSFDSNQILRFSGQTGQFIGVFASNPTHLQGPHTLIFHTDGRLYVTCHFTWEVVRFNSYTGAFLDVFVPSSTPGIQGPTGMTFGPDGNLYVGTQGTDSVLKINGTTGAFLGGFVPRQSGGLIWCEGIRFGPDGNLYVCARDTDNILCYNGATGAFISAFTAPGALGLGYPGEILFSVIPRSSVGKYHLYR